MLRFSRNTFVALLALVCSTFATSGAAHADQDLLEAIQKRSVVRIGVGYQTPPMNFIDNNGEPAGFDIELAKAIAEKMGLKFELVSVNNKTRISFLATGQVDMVLSNINHTVSRDRAIDFSETYLRDGKRVLAKKGAYKSLKDLVGKRIAVVQGSNAQQAVEEALRKLGDANPKVMSFQTDADCFMALKTGKVDGYTNDTVILVGVSQASREFELVGEAYSPTYYGIGLPENQSKWRDALNFTLREMLIDGSYKTIYAKWFGAKGAYPLPASSGVLDVWAE